MRIPDDEQQSIKALEGLLELPGLGVLNASAAAALIVDRVGTIVYCNEATALMQRRPSGEILGESIGAVSTADVPIGPGSEVWRQLLGGEHWQGNIWVTRGDGVRVPAHVIRSPLFGHEGQVVGVLSLAADRTAEYEAKQALASLALTDALTGIPNRTLLDDRLGGALTRLTRSAGLVAVLFLDIDRFKLVNDGLGHDAGDAFLIEVATRVSNAVRVGDTVARFGADEFVVVAEDIGDVADALLYGIRVVEAVREPLALGGRDVVPSVSVGIALASDDDISPQALVHDAHLAMYRAKERGGGACEMFDDAMREAAFGRLELDADLRQAIDRGDLLVHYQPIVTFAGEIIGVEALVRWQRGDRLVPPADFVPLAEESELIIALGSFVLSEAARQVAEWRSTIAPDLELSVNVSARQLADGGLPAEVRDVLARTGLEATALCVELTESALLSEPEHAKASLTELRELGVRVAVDDFGTGYSSLVYLRRFPVQVLKLDRYFVAGVAANDEDAVIISYLVSLAHALGLTSIAEGIETLAQRDELERLGCELAQGFLWSVPLPARELGELLARRCPIEAVPWIGSPPADTSRAVIAAGPRRSDPLPAKVKAKAKAQPTR